MRMVTQSHTTYTQQIMPKTCRVPYGQKHARITGGWCNLADCIEFGAWWEFISGPLHCCAREMSADVENMEALTTGLSNTAFRTALIARIVAADCAKLDMQFDEMKADDWTNWPPGRRLNRNHALKWMYVNSVHVDNMHIFLLHSQLCSATDAHVFDTSLFNLQSVQLVEVVDAILLQSYDSSAKYLSLNLDTYFMCVVDVVLPIIPPLPPKSRPAPR